MSIAYIVGFNFTVIWLREACADIAEEKKLPNRENEKAPKMRLELIKRFGGQCWFEECMEDDPDKLEFIHIKATKVMGRGRGRKERYYDVKKNPHCYALMCKYHHDQWDEYIKSFKSRRSELEIEDPDRGEVF